MKRKILFLCPYPEDKAPSQRLKFEQYYHVFKEEYEIKHSPFISFKFWDVIYKKGFFLTKIFYSLEGYLRRIKDLLEVRKYDIVYIHLWATPFGPPLFEWLFKRFAKKIIYDIDDLVYLSASKSKAHKIVNFIKGYKKPIYLMKVADHVITCTPYLDEFVRKYNPNTTDIPVSMDTDRYLPAIEYTNNKQLILGWSGSITTSKYFLLLRNVLKEIASKYTFQVLLMGDDAIEIEGINLTAFSWTKEEELKNLQKFDIGLYPLPDEEWVYGKGGGKAMQYMALGIPTVATAIGPNYRVIESGTSGFLVKTDQEWIEALSALIEQPELRAKLGRAGRERIEALYSVKVHKGTYLNIFKSVINVWD